LLDQLIHVTTLCVVLGFALPARQIWTIAASPMAPMALYAAAYVVAACATPIGVMIWLDPAFTSVALAGGARLRSLLAGAMVVSLTLFGGLLALPATLVGATLIVRHPRSSHPLDMPAGMLAVLCVGAAVGTILAMIS
jgi:hypothetical protein